MGTFSALLSFCAGNASVTGEFPSQRPVTRGFDAFFDFSLNKRLSNIWAAGNLWRHRAHYDITVIKPLPEPKLTHNYVAILRY